MTRNIELSGCSAWVVMGKDQEETILPCKSQQEGKCLKDRAREVGLPGVSVLIGTCLADEHDGIIEPLTPLARVAVILEHESSSGLNKVLDTLRNEPATNKPE